MSINNEGMEVENVENSPIIESSQEPENSNASQANLDKKEKSPLKRKRPSGEDSSDEDDGKNCPICLDTWTNSGEHRLCALKCGHLFGYKCIDRWLNSDKSTLCPTCKTKVNHNDIRFIFARRVIALDTVELEFVRSQLNSVTEEKNIIQSELAKAICKEHAYHHQIKKFESTIQELKEKLNSINNSQTSKSSQSYNNRIVRLYKDKTIDLGRDSGCRVISSSSSQDLLVVSLKSPNNLYNGFGIRKYKIETSQRIAFIGLHSATIRDMKFHGNENWLLTGAMDKKSTVVNMNTNEKIVTVNCEDPVWCCCWDNTSSDIFYVGTSRGSILKYDIRNINQSVESITTPGDYSPVVSIQHIQENTEENTPEGLLVCKLQSLWFLENGGAEYKRHPLSLEGPFSSMAFSYTSNRMLVSARPSAKFKQARHIVATLNKTDDILNCITEQTFLGGHNQKMLSRTCLMLDKNRNDIAAAYIEDTKSINLWNVNTGKQIGVASASDYVLDLDSMYDNSPVLIALTEAKMEFNRFSN